MRTTVALCDSHSGFPGYGYFPSPAGGERHTSAYYADYVPAPPTSHVANISVQRSEPSPMPVNNSPMHREQYTQQRAAATVELTNGQLTPNSNTPHLLTQALSVVNNYGPQGFGPPTSPANNRAFPPANSPGPMDVYNSSTDNVGYVQATSPQPTGFPTIVSRVNTFNGPLIAAAFTNGYH
uniref:Uncharacterized protein n=1 Tax=Strigamia maritima TaxID=126957 RepID=T1J2Q0_STRMM